MLHPFSTVRILTLDHSNFIDPIVNLTNRVQPLRMGVLIEKNTGMSTETNTVLYAVDQTWIANIYLINPQGDRARIFHFYDENGELSDCPGLKTVNDEWIIEVSNN